LLLHQPQTTKASLPEACPKPPFAPNEDLPMSHLKVVPFSLTSWVRFSFIKVNLLVAGLLMAVVLASAPAFAQDAFSSGGAMGNIGYGTQNTATQTMQGGLATAPYLSGATNGTIGPQGRDATYVTGVNTAGTVRVNNLANLEALLNIIANGLEILGIAWGGPTMILGFMYMAAGTQDAMKKVMFGAAGVTGGLATPGCINWLVASARDANLFS
jgi:hypothetical protein